MEKVVCLYNSLNNCCFEIIISLLLIETHSHPYQYSNNYNL